MLLGVDFAPSFEALTLRGCSAKIFIPWIEETGK